jgi:hypothetical protein
MGPNGELEIDPRLEIATREGPCPGERISGTLPEEHGEALLSYLENDGERDMGGRGPHDSIVPTALGTLLATRQARVPTALGTLLATRRVLSQRGKAGFRLRVGDRGILCGHRFSIIRQKLAL